MPLNFARLLILSILLSGTIGACQQELQTPTAGLPSLPATTPIAPPPAIPPATPISSPTIQPVDAALIQRSWIAYRQRLIQADGRVIDWQVGGRSTSEGQADAMLRSVIIDDPKTFAITLAWAEKNLQRRQKGKKSDHLWARKWGRDTKKNWRVLDNNFVSAADVDAVTALILAARRWSRPDYLHLATIKMHDLWSLSTVSVEQQHFLLPGPKEVFQQQNRIHLNPSYLAPYAFRLFAQVNSNRDWLGLADSSYEVLENSSILSGVDLPSDWVALDKQTGEYLALMKPNPLVSQYGHDAYRVWWRVAMDAEWFNTPQAQNYLQRHLGYLRRMWRSQQKVPAEIDLNGRPIVTGEAIFQYGMLYSAFRLVDPDLAQQIYQKKLVPQYRNQIWDNDSAYYTQNLIWLGLLPSAPVPENLLQPDTAQQAPL